MATFSRKLLLLALAVIFLGSCATVNHLDGFDVYGTRLAVVMHTPPDPRMNVDYNVFIDSHNPVFSALSVITNMAKASQAYQAELVMRDALDGAGVPDLIRDRAFSSCAKSLDADAVQSRAEADYILELDIKEWGIDAHAAWDPVTLRIQLTARLYRSFTDELVWRRNVTVTQAARGEMFGLGAIVGDMVTTQVLSELTRDELESGFRALAVQASRTVARSLEKDLDEARHKSYDDDGWDEWD